MVGEFIGLGDGGYSGLEQFTRSIENVTPAINSLVIMIMLDVDVFFGFSPI